MASKCIVKDATKIKTAAEINIAITNAFILPPALIILKLCAYVIRKLLVDFDKTGLLQFYTHV